jgi:hypothetical protein
MKRIMLAGLLAALPLVAMAAEEPVARTLTADAPAAGISKLELDLGVGEVTIKPSSDDSVHVQVKLRQKDDEVLWFFHWASSGTDKDIAAARINQEKLDDKLKLSLDYPSDKQDNIKQEWQVMVPARLALDAQMKVGQLSIDGIAGGVDAQLNVGELDINTPKGPIRAEVNVGQIRAISHTAELGDIDASSNIGDVTIYQHGKFVDRDTERRGLGRNVVLHASGADSMHLTINVGEVILKALPPDSKD